MFKKLFISAAIASMFIASCGDDDNGYVFSGGPTSSYEFSQEGDTLDFYVNADDEEWELVIGSEYTAASKRGYVSFNGDGEGTKRTGKGRTTGIKLYSKANNTRFDIVDTLILSDKTGGEKVYKYPLIVKGIALTLDADTVHYVPNGVNTLTLDVVNNVDNIAATTEEDWFTCQLIDSNSKLEITFKENESFYRRTGEMKLVGSWDEGDKAGIEVSLNFHFMQDGSTTITNDSLQLVKFNSDFNLGWDTSRPLTEWNGVEVDRVMTSKETEYRVLGLNLPNKGLTAGTLPDLSEMVYLQTLRLNGNNFTGEIPEHYYKLRDMQILWLSDNDLSGELRDEFDGFEYIFNLSLSNNSFSGVIPATMAELEYLESLQLNDNEFTGTFPEGFGNCKWMKVFMINGNYLEGAIPASYEKNKYWYQWNPEVNIIPQR